MAGDEKVFDTAKAKGETIRFGMTADMHEGNSKGFNNLVEKYGEFFHDLDADFWITMGDFFGWDNARATEQYMYDFPTLDFFEKVNTSKVPVIRVMGNHEQVNFFTAPDNKNQKYAPLGYDGNISFVGQAFEDLFPINDHGIADVLAAANQPDHKVFFSFEWGDATFVVLDPYFYTEYQPSHCDEGSYTLGPEQTAWFKNILAESNSTWVLVFMHQTGATQEDPYWDWRDLYRCYGRGGVQSLQSSHKTSALTDELIADMSERDNIVVFTGHDHIGAYNNFNGIHFISVPNVAQWNWPYIFLGYTPEEVQWDYEKEWNFKISEITCSADECDITYDDECAGANQDCSVQNYVDYVSWMTHQGKNGMAYVINADKSEDAMIFPESFNDATKTITLWAPNWLGLVVQGENMAGTVVNWEVGDRVRFLPSIDGFPVVTVSPEELVYTVYRENDFYLSTGAVPTEPPNNIDTLNNAIPNNRINIKAKKHTTCDVDTDLYTVCDDADNCPNTCNPSQLDADGDNIGDVCDGTPGCGGCGLPDCETEC